MVPMAPSSTSTRCSRLSISACRRSRGLVIGGCAFFSLTGQAAWDIHSSGMLDVMKTNAPGRYGVALLMLCAALPASADTRIKVRRMARDDVPAGKGQCDIRLQVDNEVEVSVRGDLVDIRTI